MKFLVFGCNGMAGHLISLYLKEQGHDVLGFARQRSLYVPSVTGSVQDTRLVAETIREGRFDSVINWCWHSQSVCGTRESAGRFSECLFSAFPCGRDGRFQHPGYSYEHRLRLFRAARRL